MIRYDRIGNRFANEEGKKEGACIHDKKKFDKKKKIGKVK